MNFWKTFFAALLAFIVFNGLLFLFFIVIIASIGSQSEPVIADNSVLHLKLDGPILELSEENPFAEFQFPGNEMKGAGLKEIREAISFAKDDPKIAAILLETAYPMAGPAMIDEIRDALIEFRTSGKKVYSYNDTYSESGYYLATAADSIFLDPNGDIEFNGLTLSVTFYKKLMDKLEIKPEIFRVGEFKSAVEPFLRENMSDENRLQLQLLADDIYAGMVKNMATGRKLTPETIEDLADNMKIRNAAIARESGLVDGLLYQDQLMSRLASNLELDSAKLPVLVSLSKYAKTITTDSRDNEIAILVGEGAILPGKSSEGVLGSEDFIKELRKAVKSKRVKAIIIRVNSPGGEFKSSDQMWREIQLARKVKPVIASMSDYAASGGYYLAMGCDTIVARPSTITGSIGIFGMMFDASKMLENKLGITTDEVRTGKYGEMFDLTRPLTDGERQYFQTSLEEHYKTFVTKAADGRGVPFDSIARVASGRVWTGHQAISRKLIDVEGGLDVAIKLAAKAGKVGTDYSVRYYNRTDSFWATFMSSREEATQKQVRETLGIYYPLFMETKKLDQFRGVQARMPFQMEFH